MLLIGLHQYFEYFMLDAVIGRFVVLLHLFGCVFKEYPVLRFLLYRFIRYGFQNLASVREQARLCVLFRFLPRWFIDYFFSDFGIFDFVNIYNLNIFVVGFVLKQ